MDTCCEGMGFIFSFFGGLSVHIRIHNRKVKSRKAYFRIFVCAVAWFVYVPNLYSLYECVHVMNKAQGMLKRADFYKDHRIYA